MSQEEKVQEILESLHKHIEDQKRILDEENQELLQKMKSDLSERFLNEKAIAVSDSVPTSSHVKESLKTRFSRVIEYMRPNKLLERARQAKPRKAAGLFLHGRSPVLGAMIWMFGLSLLLTLALGWIPVVGPFIGPTLGGYLGGRRAGSVLRALFAALLPALLLSIIIAALGAIAASLANHWLIGAVGVIFGGAIGVILVIHNVLLLIAAAVGGLVRQLEGK